MGSTVGSTHRCAVMPPHLRTNRQDGSVPPEHICKPVNCNTGIRDNFMPNENQTPNIPLCAVIYHDADFDGKLSRDVTVGALNRRGNTVHEYGWDYGKPLPDPRIQWEDYDRIYIVDLSVDELMQRKELIPKIRWIDHHKSAIAKYNKVWFAGLQLDGVAACRLCWFYFYGVDGQMPMVERFASRLPGEPEAVYLAGIYDVWMKESPDWERALDFQYGLRLMYDPLDTENWDRADVNKAVLAGNGLRLYIEGQNDEYSRNYAQTIDWEGMLFCALNIGQRGNSQLLRGGLKPEHEGCFAWRWDGKSVMVSLYHVPGREHHDLSKIAAKYGGGGHRGACGFRITMAELEKILTKPV